MAHPPSDKKALLADIQGRQLSCVSANDAFNHKKEGFAFVMKRLNDLEYLKLNKLHAFWYKLMLSKEYSGKICEYIRHPCTQEYKKIKILSALTEISYVDYHIKC